MTVRCHVGLNVISNHSDIRSLHYSSHHRHRSLNHYVTYSMDRADKHKICEMLCYLQNNYSKATRAGSNAQYQFRFWCK